MPYNLGKWRKHNILSKSPELASILPQTRMLDKQHFWSLLDNYKRVIIKPAGSSGGFGVMQVTSLGKGKYEVHYSTIRRVISGRDAAYSFIKNRTGLAPYIVQQKINLAMVNGRPFDVRVMVQRMKGSSWTVTGKLAKIAGPGFIITNTARSRGRAVPLSDAIRSSNIRGASWKEIHMRLDRLSLLAVKKLEKYYRLKNIGLDMGIDPTGKVWFIEANFMPAMGLFRHLKDKTMYNRIIYYSRH